MTYLHVLEIFRGRTWNLALTLFLGGLYLGGLIYGGTFVLVSRGLIFGRAYIGGRAYIRGFTVFLYSTWYSIIDILRHREQLYIVSILCARKVNYFVAHRCNKAEKTWCCPENIWMAWVQCIFNVFLFQRLFFIENISN